jgi:hypothetical protein
MSPADRRKQQRIRVLLHLPKKLRRKDHGTGIFSKADKRSIIHQIE